MRAAKRAPAMRPPDSAEMDHFMGDAHTPMDNPKRWSLPAWLRRFLICQVWAFLLFVPSLGMYARVFNRYLWCWSIDQLVLRFGCVTAVGLGLFVLGEVLHRFAPGLYRLAALVGGLATAVLLLWYAVFDRVAPEYKAIYAGGALVAAAVLAQVTYRHGWTGAVWREKMAFFCLLLSPVLLLYWINAVLFPTYPRLPVPPVEQAGAIAEPAQPSREFVFLFVFDEWPYRLTFDEAGQVRPHMPNLRQAAAEMCVFTDGHAPACHTVMSLPRLLFQTPAPFALESNRAGFRGERFEPCRERPSLFTAARARGQRTYMLGWYHPYHVLLGDSVDFVRSTGYFDELGDSPGQQVRYFYWDWACRILGERLARGTVGDFDIMRNSALTWQNDTLLEYAHAIIADPRPGGQFAVIHLPLPHWPFCYCATGLRPLHVRYPPNDPDFASEQLTYLDGVIGDLVTRLKRAGKWDQATIVITSDHNWRQDPARPMGSAPWLSHVPLLIRLPDQKSRVQIDAGFSTVHLAGLLDAVRELNGEYSRIPDLVRTRWPYQPLDDREVWFEQPF
jgi:hypothetical protein